MLYGAEILGTCDEGKKYRTCILMVQQRCTMRVVSAYQTVSKVALMVVSEFSINLLVKEREIHLDECPRDGTDIGHLTALLEQRDIWKVDLAPHLP